MPPSDPPQSEPAVGYRIGAASRLTGLSEHTIRVWERRYGAVTPHRTAGGDRIYREAEIRRLNLLGRLTRAGHAIGTVANLPDDELEAILDRHHPEPAPPEAVQAGMVRPEPEAGLSLAGVRERFLERIGRLDVAGAEQLVARLVATLEPQDLLMGFFSELFEEIGTRWESGSLTVAQEHAASALIRNQLAVLMRAISGNGSGPVAIVGTPAGERHEFGALLAALTAARAGWRVIYLGPDLPAGEWAGIAEARNATALLLSWVSAPAEETQAELVRIRQALPESMRIYLGGWAGSRWQDAPAGITVVADLRELERRLRRR